MSKKFKTVKKFYDSMLCGKRLWSEKRVHDAVMKGWITAEEYKIITGEEYVEYAEEV